VPKVHNLDIYECDGTAYCLGCVDAEEQDGGGSDAGASGGAGSSGAASAGAASDVGGDDYAPRPSTAGDPTGSEEPTSHLIEVRVINALGQVQRDIPFEVHLPDGSIRDGKTGADGFIRLSVAPHSGSCTLRFPEHEPSPNGGA